jgi:hypothetical protein
MRGYGVVDSSPSRNPTAHAVARTFFYKQRTKALYVSSSFFFNRMKGTMARSARGISRVNRAVAMVMVMAMAMAAAEAVAVAEAMVAPEAEAEAEAEAGQRRLQFLQFL